MAKPTGLKGRAGGGGPHRGLGLKGGLAQGQRRREPAVELDVVVVDAVDAAALRFLGPTG